MKTIKDIVANLNSAKLDPNSEVVIAPPSLYLLISREHLKPEIEVAAQNVFDKPNGAFTGEISVEQLKDSGITWTLIGHSERRVILREDNPVCLPLSRKIFGSGDWNKQGLIIWNTVVRCEEDPNSR